MGRRGFLHITLLTLIGGGAVLFWLAPKDTFNPAETALFDGLDQLVSERNPAPADFVDAFGLPAECRSGDCYVEGWSQPVLGNPRVRLSQEVGGSIFEIKLDRVCVRTDRVTVKYPGGKIESLCSHGSCPKYAVWSDWASWRLTGRKSRQTASEMWASIPANCFVIAHPNETSPVPRRRC